jgi:hypothetical protein
MRNLGIVLVVIGIVMMVITGFNFETRKGIGDVGNNEVSTDRRPMQWSPIIGGILLVGGIIMLATAKNKVKQP